MKIEPHIYLIYDRVRQKPYYVGKQGSSQTSYITGSTYLQRYIKMYGRESFWDRFSRLVLEYSPKELLNEREEFYIKKYKTFIKGGNRTRGGTWDIQYRVRKIKPVLQFSMQGEFLREWEAVTQPYVEGLVTNRDGVSACCIGKQKSCGGFLWKFKGDSTPIKGFKRAPYPKRRRPVAVEVNGETFRNIKDACDKLRMDYYTIKKLNTL